MKAILMSIRPQWVSKILNNEKTIEIRKRFPSNYVGWVYIYVTKGKNPLVKCSNGKWYVKDKDFEYDMRFSYSAGFNGKVVARFWCDKVEEHRPFFHWCIEKETCLTCDDVLDYLDSKDNSVGNPKRQGKVYAIHITKLEIFDKPKEISEFSIKVFPHRKDNLMTRYLSRAPQSFCYIEI